MEQEFVYVPITPAKSVSAGRVFGEWETAFGCHPRGGFAAGECSGGLGMNVGFGARENSGNCGVGGFVADPEKMSFTELLGLAESGAPIRAEATPAKRSGGIPDDTGINNVPPTPMEKDDTGINNVPPTPMEKEQGFRKKKVKTQRQQKVKRKKHRPKIFYESKPKRVPKSKPKREGEKRKYARRSSTGQPPGSAMRSGKVIETSTLNPQTPKPLVGKRKRKCTLKASKYPSKSCKRGINFDFEDSVEENNSDVETVSTSAEEQRNQVSDCNIEFYANSSQYVDHKVDGSDMECTVNSSIKLENKTASIYATNVISAENNLYEKRLTVGNNSVTALVGSLDNIGKQTVDCAEQVKMESLNYFGLCLKPAESSPHRNGGKEIMGVMNHNRFQSNSLQVYQRRFRANEIIKNSRKFGPNCPMFAKKKRRKTQRGTKYKFWFLDIIAPNYALRSNFKKHLNLAIKNSILSVLHPMTQIKVATADQESFKCSLSLFPIVKSKRKRSKSFRQCNLSCSLVTHSNMGKKSSNVEFACRALDSFLPVIAKGKRSKNLIRRQGLPSSNTITHNSPNNLTSPSKTLSHETNAFKLEAPTEIPAYPPQCVKIHPQGYDIVMGKISSLLQTFIPTIEGLEAKVKLSLHPEMQAGTSHAKVGLKIHPSPPRPLVPLREFLWQNSQSKFRGVEKRQPEAFTPTTKSSHAKVKLRIHPPRPPCPPHPDSALQEYMLPTTQSTSGLQSKFKVKTRQHWHGTTMSKTNSMLSDIEFCRQDHFPIAQGSQFEFMKYLMESNIQKLEKLQISDEHGQLVVRDTNFNGAVIPYEDKFGSLKRRKVPKVDLDPETIRRWNLLMEKDDSELPEDEDEKKKKDWEEQKELFRKRLQVFITCMHLLQGDRRFSRWKGSVVDSVVGVFLTQNVSDYLSSNAFMSLAAKFPVPSRCCDIQVDSPCSQESTSNTTGPNSQQSHETFISSEEKGPSSLEDERVVEHPPVNHDFSCSSPDKHPIVTQGPSAFESSIALKETLEFELTGNSDKMRPPLEVELPSCGSAVGTSLCGCESGIIASSTERLEDLNGGAHASLSLSASSNPVHNGCTSSFDGNLGLGCDCGEHKNKNLDSEDVNKNCGSKSGCACVRGMLEGVAKASANSNTLLNELEVAMEDNTVSLNGTRLEDNTLSRSREKKGKVTKMPKPDVDWEELRRTYYNSNRTPGRNLDSIDWDAVRCAPVGEIAKVIETRGMNNVLAAKIKAFLNRLVEDHGSMDLEWLKDVPPDKAKEFLLSIRGVGLKSTECVRLLTLGHHAFPVDTNIARIVVRLGWVPLEPLPGDLQIHLLEQYPQMDSIQKYLWPRLCSLDKNILYVLHYQLITFGKVICTKKNPNCNACPMRAECRHFASAFASSRLRLRGAPEKRVVVSKNQVRDYGMSNSDIRQPVFPHIERDIEDFPYGFKDKDNKRVVISQDHVRDYGMSNSHMKQSVLPHMERDIEDFPYGFKDNDDKCYTQTTAPATEILASQEAEPTGALVRDIEDFPCEFDNKDEKSYIQTCEPIIEVPASPEPESTVSLESNIPDEPVDDDEIPHIKLDTEEFKRNLVNFLNPEFENEEVSNALVALTPKATTIPAPKIKRVERLRTKHRVYIIPDSHPLLVGFERRENDDPCPYLLAIWPKESLNQKESNPQDLLICDGDTNLDHTICGTILIPCRTANRGNFPLNGTYFQVNEVFADHETSESPINVPRKWIWNLSQRNLYCGSTASAIARGMDMDEIQHCFWNGFVCVRAFDRRTRNPMHLSKRLHELPSSIAGKKRIVNDE